jgi:hypothetical protein
MRNAYMVEGSMNLPWLNHRKHGAEIAEATAQATEQDAELAALRNAAFGQIQDALVEASAAQSLRTCITMNCVPRRRPRCSRA